MVLNDAGTFKAVTIGFALGHIDATQWNQLVFDTINELCPQSVPAEKTSWGKIKSLYASK